MSCSSVAPRDAAADRSQVRRANPLQDEYRRWGKTVASPSMTSCHRCSSPTQPRGYRASEDDRRDELAVAAVAWQSPAVVFLPVWLLSSLSDVLCPTRVDYVLSPPIWDAGCCWGYCRSRLGPPRPRRWRFGRSNLRLPSIKRASNCTWSSHFKAAIIVRGVSFENC